MNCFRLEDAINKRILLLDGAMGTMIQKHALAESDYRGNRFEHTPFQLKGNNDILVLTRPDIIKDIHVKYLQAGADIITTNTFNSQRISMAEYGCENLVKEINEKAVCLARESADEFSTAEWPRFVLGTIGPTNRTCSMNPNVEDPSLRTLTFDELADAYHEQIVVLLKNGVDAIMFETIFDTLNAKAGIYAFEKAKAEVGINVPLMLSVTVNDKMGRMLSGQTLEAFLASVEHASLFSVGLNCSFGPSEMLPFLRNLSRQAPYHITAHPNAGLPNLMGDYDLTPELFATSIRIFIQEGLVDVVGGCCGTTPEHIAALKPLLTSTIRKKPQKDNTFSVSGLERLRLSPETAFVNVGERCNVAGSRKFLRLIKDGDYRQALEIARKQVEDGAMVIDVNMDDALLDAKKEMTTFLNLISSDPDICKAPVMIDSSDWDVISAGLKCLQGKSIVNSISLKAGEEFFLSCAREINRFGAAVVVMAFDENGQAETFERKIQICERAYRLLTGVVGFSPENIIFDPNILTIATGIPSHDFYAMDFIRATKWIKQNLPGAHVSGGVSNLSFSFRGNNYLREAMHAVFLYHSRKFGMDFGIVNPSNIVSYTDLPADLIQVLENAILSPSAKSTEELLQIAIQYADCKTDVKQQSTDRLNQSVGHRLSAALVSGTSEFLESDINEALNEYPKAVDIIEGPLMDGMQRVGELFGEGKMFLPQVVKSARIMKEAVAILQPTLELQKSQSASSLGKVLLATVKGDVHDIGKNIVSMIMACNGFEIIDLGVMVPAEEIVKKALEFEPDAIGLSGLITPSLEEMVWGVRVLAEHGIKVPVMIGGAATSDIHTAARIAPEYNGPVIWMKDASQNAPVVLRFLHPDTKETAFSELKEKQEALRQNNQLVSKPLKLEEARNRKLNLF